MTDEQPKPPNLIDEVLAMVRVEMERQMTDEAHSSTLFEWHCAFRDLLTDHRNADTNAIQLAVMACRHWIDLTYMGT